MSVSLRHRGAHLNQRQLIPGSYLTDGQRLFRVLSRLVNGRSTLVSIEDCLTLETRAYAASELGTMPLRPVRGAHVEVTASRSPTTDRLTPKRLSSMSVN